MSSEWKKWMCSDEKEDVECAFFSNQFWKLLTLIVQVIEPIFSLIRLVDFGKPTIGKFYEYYDQSMEKINEMERLTSEKKKEIVTIINDRWYFMHSSMHCARIVLDPEWQGKGQEKYKEIMMGFRKIRDKFFPVVRDQANIETQLARYRNMEGLFADPATFLVAKEMPARTWWSSYESETLELQSFAIKVQSQVTVASACERNWSTFEFIHSKKPNRLTSELKSCRFSISI